MRRFVFGLIVGCVVVFPLAVYLGARLGVISLATTAHPLPGEELLAKTALRASIGGARELKPPIEATGANLLAGAKAYRENCAVCHGLAGQPETAIARGMFPRPPQLLDPKEMVTDDPEGVTFWKVSHGIRLSGMPGFGTVDETTRWQVSLLLKHADQLPAAVGAELRRPEASAGRPEGAANSPQRR